MSYDHRHTTREGAPLRSVPELPVPDARSPDVPVTMSERPTREAR